MTRSVDGDISAGHCHVEDPAGQGGRLRAHMWASGGSAVQPSPDPDETVLNQPKPHPSSKIV